ncbi:MAG: HIRAN domain-containing protein [Anaerolineae bacterium]|nr:HIRAN domain-containing protein [Anaerolineae bacterium]
MNCRAEAQRAMRMYRMGQVKEAKELLVSLVYENRDCEDVWMGLASCVDNIEHKKKCLREVARINPHRTDVQKILTDLEAQVVLLQSSIEEISTGGLFDRKVIHTHITGMQHDGRPKVIRRLMLGQKLRLIRQPENPYDVYAINVQTEHREDVGYIPKKLAAKLAPYIDEQGLQLEASVLSLRIDTLGDKYQVEIAIDTDETLTELTDLYSTNPNSREIQYLVDERSASTYLVFSSAEPIRNQILEFLMRQNIPYQNAGFCDYPSSDGYKYDHYVQFERNRADLLDQVQAYIDHNFDVRPTVAQIEKKYDEDQQVWEEQTLDLAVQIEDHTATIQQLKDEKKRVEHRNHTLESEKARSSGALQENLYDLCIELAGRSKPDRVLEACGSYFSDRLVVLDNALESAKKINVDNGRMLFELIWKLATVYRDQLLIPDTGNSPIDIFGANIFSAHESDSTMNVKRARRERTFSYNEQELLMTAHLKLGNNYRIHFYWLEDEQKIIIGHCGFHLFTP